MLTTKIIEIRPTIYIQTMKKIYKNIKNRPNFEMNTNLEISS